MSAMMRDLAMSFPEMNGCASTAALKGASRAEQASKREKKRGRMCKFDGCENYIVHKGLCCRHGGGKKCSVAGCSTSAKHSGLCWKHGAKQNTETDLLFDFANYLSVSLSATQSLICWSSVLGGSTECDIDGGTKRAKARRLCWAHGGGKRCNFDDCNKPAYERTQNFCAKHHAEMQHVNYFEV